MWRKWLAFWSLLLTSAVVSVVVVLGGLWALSTLVQVALP